MKVCLFGLTINNKNKKCIKFEVGKRRKFWHLRSFNQKMFLFLLDKILNSCVKFTQACSQDILGCSHCSSQHMRSCSCPGKDAAMSIFCVPLCTMIPAHHILPASSVEEVSAAATSSGVSLGIQSHCSHRQTPHRNVLTSVLVLSVSDVHCVSHRCVSFSFHTLALSLPLHSFES